MEEQLPRWRRKAPGFRINKRLKRLRLNQRLRKTSQPKNAIMVLNEMKPGVQFTFPETQGPMPNSLYLVHAELDGKTYIGQGLSKPLARQNAAENALKALLLEKMTAASMKARIDAESDGQSVQSMDSSTISKEENNEEGVTPMDTTVDESDEIPWSSLASFALYKLFLEWHNQGTSVPVPRPGLPSPVKGIKREISHVQKTPVQKELPANATNIHPVMLLNQMRPGLTYVELNRVGNPPNTMFTLAVDIDGIEYSGTGKEARKKELKKNKKQRQLVRAAVLKGKDLAQIIKEMEKIDQMEYNVMQPPPFNEEVLKDKRKRLKETLDRILKMYAKDDQEKWAELKEQLIQYERRRIDLVSYFEAVRHAQQVQVDEIPLPSAANDISRIYSGSLTSQIPLPDMPQPPAHMYPPHPHYIPQHHPLMNIPPGMPRMLRPGPPSMPRMPPPQMQMPNLSNMTNIGNPQMQTQSATGSQPKTPNVLSAAPQLINRKDKDGKSTTIIEAKPQIRNLAADVIRLLPTSLRVKRNDKRKPSILSRQEQLRTKGDAYMQFMQELEGLL